MEAFSGTGHSFSFPVGLVRTHYDRPTPFGFQVDSSSGGASAGAGRTATMPSFYTAHLPGILEWLHEEEKQNIPRQKNCAAPLLLYDKMLSFEKLLFHYEGNSQSAQLIRSFLELFKLNIRDSSATIISPSFIPKSRMKEEQELIKLIRGTIAETSFIKFNFSRIEEFCSYAISHDHTLLVTARRYQTELVNLFLPIESKEREDGQLSFYLGT